MSYGHKSRWQYEKSTYKLDGHPTGKMVKKTLTPVDLLSRMIIGSLPNFIVSVSLAGSRAFMTLCSGVRKEEGKRKNTFCTPDESIIISSLFANKDL